MSINDAKWADSGLFPLYQLNVNIMISVMSQYKTTPYLKRSATEQDVQRLQ